MSTGWIVLGVIVIIVLFAFGAYNRLVALSQRVNQAFADIDVQLKQRHDLIPNLVETVKGYASHERGTLDDVIKARNSAMSAQGPAQVGAAENQLSRRARTADRAVGGLSRPQGQRQLPAACQRTAPISKTRSRPPPLLQQRGPANSTPASSAFPAVLFAGMFGFTRKEFFDLGASRAEVETVPSVKF